MLTTAIVLLFIIKLRFPKREPISFGDIDFDYFWKSSKWHHWTFIFEIAECSPMDTEEYPFIFMNIHLNIQYPSWYWKVFTLNILRIL